MCAKVRTIPGPYSFCTGQILDPEDDLYRIGTVANMTDLSVERLRAWERRYGLQPAHRAGKTRFYNLEQVERLKKIKRLIDKGHPISSLASLTDEQLDERLVTQRNLAMRPATAGLIGPNLLVLEQQQDHTSRIDVRARWANMDAFMSDQSGADTLDVIVVQLPVLSAQHIENIAKFQPKSRIVAIYQFATAKHIAATQELGVPTLNWPTSWQEIEHACATTAGMPLRAARSAARRFSDEELIAIAASSDDQSNCPQHLVTLISSLNAFADYSLEYAEEAVESALYQRVHSATTQARAQLELALEVLVEADQLLWTPG